MNWLERMNWSFLDEDDAAAIWEDARRWYFEGDTPLDTAFTLALKDRGIEVQED